MTTSAFVSERYPVALRAFHDGRWDEAARVAREILAVDAGQWPAWNILGVVAARSRRLDEAEQAFRTLLRLRPDDVETHHNLGSLLHEFGQLAAAEAAYRAALALKPDYGPTLTDLAGLLHRAGRLAEAEGLYRRALALAPERAELHHNLSVLLNQQGRRDEAEAVCRTALALDPAHAAARRHLERLARPTPPPASPSPPWTHYNAALADYRAGRIHAAEQTIRAALAQYPAWPDALNFIGVIAADTGRHREAEAAYREALRHKPDYANAHNNLGNLLKSLGRFQEAEAAYRQALVLEPGYADAYANLGTLLCDTGRWAEAEAAYRKALTLAPDYASAHNGLGNVFNHHGRLEDAEAAYRRAVAANPRHAHAYNGLGAVLKHRERFEDAAAAYRQALAIDPDHYFARNNLDGLLALICAWPEQAQSHAELRRRLQRGEMCGPPFVLLNCSEDGELLRRCAENYIRHTFPDSTPWRGGRPRHAKIRLAYISPDFSDHPVAQLLGDLIERHDRDRFEVIGVSIGPVTRDAWRERLERGFDRFLEGHARADPELAAQLRALDIDIAIDLAGHTQHSRPGIFAARVAPIQVNYLGYPGTSGAPFVDYLLADGFVIPEGDERFYSEQVVRLPTCCHPSAPREISDRVFSRQELGLPERGLVFCAFHNAYKIQPPLFALWMRLLARVEGSVLWLPRLNSVAQRNLQRAAAQHGIAPERVIFAAKLPRVADHLARYHQADLFLDALPYNAHTTAGDALWAGLPVLTCAGQTFAGRVAGSLLRAAGLPELVTDSLEAYEALALRLATHPEDLAALRRKLEANRTTQPLFDPDRFRRQIEAAYVGMWEIWQRGEEPRAFVVDKFD